MYNTYVETTLLRGLRDVISIDRDKDSSSYYFSDAMLDVETICTTDEITSNVILYVTRKNGTHLFYRLEIGEETIKNIVAGISYELKGIHLLPTNEETYKKMNFRSHIRYDDIESALKEFKRYNS